jgi:hypothetical protein
MSMTPDELEQFQIANMTEEGTIDYEDLRYVPLIKVCDSQLFTGGWDLNSVINELASRMGLQIVCNVRNYWLRQVQADMQSSYFDTIISLINFLRPFVYIQDGILYILNNPVRGGSANFDKISTFTQAETFNYDSKVTYVRVEGGLGVWDQSKYQGIEEPEHEETMINTIESSTQKQLAYGLIGNYKSRSKWLGSTQFGFGQIGTINIPTSLPIADKTTTTEVWRVDPFGNNKGLISRHIETTNFVLGPPPIKTFDSIETYTYDFLNEKYEKPRLTEKKSVIGKYAWELVVYGGYGSFRHYKADVDTIVENYFYAPDGSILAETMTRESDCWKFATTGQPDLLVELTLADYYWVPEGGLPPTGVTVKEIVEQKITRYRQLDSDLYQKMTYHRNLGGVRRQAGDGIFSINTENIKGRVPKYPKSYRKMQVYAETAKPVDQPMDVPAIIVSNPNIIDWTDAQNILEEIERNQVNFEYIINRTLTIPADIPIDIGWAAEFGTIKAGKEGEVPSVTVIDGIVASWQKIKDAQSGMVQTVITLEGRVAL